LHLIDQCILFFFSIDDDGFAFAFVEHSFNIELMDEFVHFVCSETLVCVGAIVFLRFLCLLHVLASVEISIQNLIIPLIDAL